MLPSFSFSFARPPLACSYRFACLGLFPRPRAWDVRADADLRLLALLRSACSLRCRRSLAIARSLFPAQSLSGLPVDVSHLPPHRMSGEPVKTALADRSSIKPFQFIPIHSRSRIGCRMMSPLAACLPSSSCVAIVLLACRFLIRSAHSSRPSPRCACRASVRLLVSPPRSVGHTRLISSDHPACYRYVRSPRSASSPRSSCREAGRCQTVRLARMLFFSCGIFAQSGAFLGVRVL